jgi:hypothetical protein
MGKRGPKKGQGGRPPIKTDAKFWRQLDEMGKIDCTQEEVSSIFGISINSLNNICKKEKGETFCEYYSKKREGGKRSLRRMQWKAAEEGNVTMLIWLGKNRLGQTDKAQAEVTHKESIEIDLGKLSSS